MLAAVADYNTPECGFDGGDCCVEYNKYPDCKVYFPYWIGDGWCRGSDYNTPERGFDGGDCEDFNSKYPDCTVKYPSWVGSGGQWCNGGDYNTPNCPLQHT